MGGNGVCGRDLCCCTFLNNFEAVSIKMAKEQNMSLNPSKISGVCGRLMCCLKYEQEAYEEKLARLPKIGSIVETEDGEGIVEIVEILKENVRVKFNDEEGDGYFYKNEKVAIKIDEEKEVEDVLYLSSLASDVYLFTDLENLSLPSNVYLIKGEIKKVDGDQVMSSLTYEENNEEHVLPVKALFLPSFGGGSDSFLSSLPLERKPDGSIVTDEQMKTNIPGVFAIGDCRNTLLKQVVTACSDGAIASLSIIRYLREVK